MALRGWNELGLLAIGGLVMAGARLGRPGIAALAAACLPATVALAAGSGVAAPITLTRLTFFFLKVGSVLFGSGYVLLAFLRADLVDRWNWLSDAQLIDAVTIGQVTPGPGLHDRHVHRLRAARVERGAARHLRHLRAGVPLRGLLTAADPPPAGLGPSPAPSSTASSSPRSG